MYIKNSLLSILFFISANVFAVDTPETMFVAITSSGPGGAILGHSYLVFCEDRNFINFVDCEAYEYNLEINQDHKIVNFKEKSFLDKIYAFMDSPFRVYKHNDFYTLQQKYLNRDQFITYLRYSGSKQNIQRMFNDLVDEKKQREDNDFNDYDINDNNCATKIVDLLESVGGEIEKNQSYSNFGFKKYLSSFPITLENNLRESGLFDSALEVSKTQSRAFLIE